jgi:hypothetical protein
VNLQQLDIEVVEVARGPRLLREYVYLAPSRPSDDGSTTNFMPRTASKH